MIVVEIIRKRKRKLKIIKMKNKKIPSGIPILNAFKSKSSLLLFLLTFFSETNTLSTLIISLTVFANTPTTSLVLAKGTIPSIGYLKLLLIDFLITTIVVVSLLSYLPKEGLNPQQPHKAAGILTEPVVSVPKAISTTLVTTAIALPPELPPGIN